MKPINAKLKGLSILYQRMEDLKKDGYDIITNYQDNNLCIVKLRHRNGKRITLKYSAKDGVVSQSTNNVQNFSDKVR